MQGEWQDMNKNYCIFIFLTCLLLSSCNIQNNKPTITYEKKVTFLSTDEFFYDVIYMPTISSNFVLDEDMLEEASGLYKIKNPSQIKIDKFNKNGYKVFQNEYGEILVLCTKI